MVWWHIWARCCHCSLINGFRIESQYNYVNLYIKLQHCFRNDSFIARTLLAAIDHNSHLFRRAALNRDGKKKYNKVYSKRSKNWRVTAVLEGKTYDFWAVLTSGILQRKIDDKDSILKKVELSAEHPKNQWRSQPENLVMLCKF